MDKDNICLSKSGLNFEKKQKFWLKIFSAFFHRRKLLNSAPDAKRYVKIKIIDRGKNILYQNGLRECSLTKEARQSIKLCSFIDSLFN